MNATILTLAAVLLLCPSLFADQVTLKNGDRLSGTIETSDTKKLVIKTEFEGEVTVQWGAVTAIQSNQPLHVGLVGGQMVVGPVTTTNGEVSVATQNAGTITTALDSVRVVRSNSEQAAYEAHIQRLEHPRLTDLWGGFFDTGLSVTRGNSQTLSFVMSANAVRKSSRDTITVYANSIFANNGTTGTTVTTANAIKGGVRMELNVSKKTFMFGFADFQHDQFQLLDLRNVLGGGYGYHIIQTDKTTFDVDAGGAYDQAFYSTPLTRRFGELTIGEAFAHAVSKRTQFNEKFDFYPNISDIGEYRFDLNVGAVTALNSWLGWQVTFTDGYVSNPPPLIKSNDLLLSTGLRITFGRGSH